MKKFLLGATTALSCAFLALLCAIFALLCSDRAPEVIPSATDATRETIHETIPEATQPTLPPADPDLVVHYIDVGRADCMLLECAGEYLLIDGGDVEDGELVVSYLNQIGVERLRVIATHPHIDHVGGLLEVLSAFEVEEIISPVTTYHTETFRKFSEKMEKLRLSFTIPTPGDRLSLGNAVITVMGPVRKYEKVNDNSLVLMVTYQNTRFLFTADMERNAERDMLDYWGDSINWDCDVLKVGHHGDNSATLYPLLYEVLPEYAVISVGKNNSSGFPREETLSRLRNAGVSVFRTDHLGHVTAHSDGQRILFSWENHDAIPENVEPAEISMQTLYGHKQSMKFHLWNCRYTPVENICVEFTSYSDAIAASYTPCKHCLN